MKGRQQSPRLVRGLGILLIVIGLALSGGMTYLLVWLDGLVHGAHPGQSWRGTPAMTAATFHLFQSVLAFGVLAGLGGVYMAVTGRRHPALIGLVVLTLLPILWFCSQVFQLAPHR